MTEFHNKVRPGKVLILLGARRVGKSELIKAYLKDKDESTFLLLSGEDQQTVEVLQERSVVNYARLIGDRKMLIIDEAQKVDEIGLKLKVMVDHFPDVAFIATGSSVFDLTNKLGEPLVGRSNTLMLYPLAQMEFAQKETFVETKSHLEERLILGSYPELTHYKTWIDKEEYLRELTNSYLLRDILEFEGIRRADKIMDILRMLAFQIGREVNVEELAKNAKGISRNTVENYLDLLSKVFIIYKVEGFSRNLRKEITKMNRWYFYDNGIRNAVINNYNKISLRADSGQLWENYIMAERLKFLACSKRHANRYFWRTYDQQEIDLIEEEAAVLRAYEFKWSEKGKTKAPGGWSKAYPDASFNLVNPKNYLDFITT
ncbi:ATP-binding protein [Cryomorpha ignava]|nr:ATP-binding protein [Cryomorpha ignava]